MGSHMASPTVSADNEWSPLRAVIVGRAGKACFPSEPAAMIKATMPIDHQTSFKPANPFPKAIVDRAEQELDQLSAILEGQGVTVYRADDVDWVEALGYTAAMPRDGLIAVGQSLIEAPFAWNCRKHEISLAYQHILEDLAKDPSCKIVRRPEHSFVDSLYEDVGDRAQDRGGPKWIINNTRPAFDAADFMRFGKVILGQYSHVTNAKGVEHLRQHLPPGYTVELLEVDDPHAMHIDATILPLRQGLLVYHPDKVTERSLRSHAVLRDWELLPFPFTPTPPADPPLFMTSPWLSLNALVLDGERVIVEAQDIRTANWFESLGMRPILCPFRNVNSIGGSFHCATVDLVRGS